MEKHPLHLKNPELQTSPEVQRAVERKQQKTGEKVPNDPAERIKTYLKRLESLVIDPKKEQRRKGLGDIERTERPRALSLLREMVLNEYVRPNKEQMAQGAARVEQHAARQMGIQAEYNNETLEQRGEIAVGDLESSLDQWINYLSNPNEPYPTWFRYYVFRNILNLGEYDKDKQEFPKRSKGTFKLFPDVDRGALAYVEEIMTAAQDDTVLARLRESQKEFGTPEVDMWTPQKAQAFVKMSFAKQYAQGIETQGTITQELRAETRGEWVHYHQDKNPKELWKSLQNKGTAWCTRGYPTAETQLKGGDFYVYYTLDATGKPTIPRIAIRMKGQNKIAEPPRGVFDSQQNLEPNMFDILEEKLKEFGEEADTYRKKSEDMRLLTALEKKQENDEPFTKDDLVFLYEINSSIEGFGYQKDPRIGALLKKRKASEDLSRIFNVSPNKISRTPQEALTGDKLLHYGSLILWDTLAKEPIGLPQTVLGNVVFATLTSAKGVRFPKTIKGDLTLNSLSSSDELVLPETIEGGLGLLNLITAKGLVFPETITGSLDLGSLETAIELVLPKKVGGSLNLSGLLSTAGLDLPNEVGGNLDLSLIESVKDLVLPEKLGGLYLNLLTSVESLKLPATIAGDLVLPKLTTLKGVTLPRTITGSLDLESLTSSEGLIMPEVAETIVLTNLDSAQGLNFPINISGSLYLNNISSMKGVVLPRSIGNGLVLEEITSIEGLILPEHVGGMVTFGKLSPEDAHTLQATYPQLTIQN